MPASRSVAILTLLVVLSASSTLATNSATKGGSSNTQSLPTPSSSLSRSLQWLAANQTSDGSYGAYEEHIAAAAAYALWLNDSNSGKAALSYSWLAAQLNSSSAWFWGAEADVPGAVLYSIASSNDLSLVNTTLVESQLLRLQSATTGGFEGYSYCSSNCNTANPSYLTVTSSVDTDMALLGLVSSNLIPAQNQTLAIQYLLTLQNPDGSFNLTSTKSYDPIYSLGPDQVSITALTLLALKSDGFTMDKPPVSKALKFLSKAALADFCGNGHDVYSAALSTLVFSAYDQTYDAVTTMVYILSQQNSDGGFSDSSRSFYPQSNALDTGWAVVALERMFLEETQTPTPINCRPVAGFAFNPRSPTEGVVVQFNASMSHDPDTDQLSYSWTFGDGSSAEGMSPRHAYAQGGTFTVTLAVTDSGTNPPSLSNTRWQTITVLATTVQNASSLPLTVTQLEIVVGVICLAIIAGVSVYLIRRSAKRSTTAQS